MDEVTTKEEERGLIQEGKGSSVGCPPPGAVLARVRRAVREKDGSMALEAAFVLPLFFLLLFGIFEFSLALTSYCSASYAVRSASRYASVHSANSLAPTTAAKIQSLVQSNVFMPGTSSSVITVTYSPNTNAVGNVVNVGMTWTQSISLPGYHSTFSVGSQTNRVITR